MKEPIGDVIVCAGVHVTGTEYVDRGSAIQLVCNATGRPDPPHNVDWYKVCKRVKPVQGAPIKSSSLGKIHYLSYCERIFHQIYSFY